MAGCGCGTRWIGAKRETLADPQVSGSGPCKTCRAPEAGAGACLSAAQQHGNGHQEPDSTGHPTPGYPVRVRFLDEPTLGLDVSAQAGLRRFSRGSNRRRGVTVLLTSRYKAHMLALCPPMIVLDLGQLLCQENGSAFPPPPIGCVAPPGLAPYVEGRPQTPSSGDDGLQTSPSSRDDALQTEDQSVGRR
jgi:hypothetical protein